MDAYLIGVPATEGAGLLESSDAVRVIIEQRRGSQLALEDAWAALHFVLSAEMPIPKGEARRRGVSWDDNSLENVLMGGTDTPYNGSFGPARFLAPEEVKRLSTRLSSVSTENFGGRYDPHALDDAQIPPGGWEEGECPEWLINAFVSLKKFYLEAAERGEGLLLFMI